MDSHNSQQTLSKRVHENLSSKNMRQRGKGCKISLFKKFCVFSVDNQKKNHICYGDGIILVYDEAL
jgi:hypothetical protein